MEVPAVCHIHSTWSYDGKWPLDALARRFSSRGYRVVMMTEHDRGFTESRHSAFREACAQVSTAKTLVVPGIEYSDSANRVHVLVWGTPFLGENLPTGEMLDAAGAAGGVAVLAHPSRKDAWRCFDPSWADMLSGVEIWNRKYDGWAPSKTATPLLERANAIPFVGLDFHTRRQSFPLAMTMDIDSKVTEQTVLECIRARRVTPRVFGLQVDGQLVRSAFPILGALEASRKRCASASRKVKLRV